MVLSAETIIGTVLHVIRRLAVAAGVAILAGCSASGPGSSGDRTIQSTTTQTLTRPPATPSTGPIAAGPTSAAAGGCPFLDVTTAADDLGVRMGNTEVLSSGGHVVGCRFYATQDPAYRTSEHLPGPDQPVLQITSSRFGDVTSAHNSMVREAEAGANARGDNLSASVEGIAFQTRFYPADGGRDWAYTFRAGTTVVTVTTVQTDTAFDARAVASSIAGGF